MKKSRLISLLESCSETEQADFLHFLAERQKNYRTDYLGLYQQLLKFAPEFSSPKLSKPAVWQQWNPAKNYQELRFNNYLSELLQILYEFLAVQTVQNNRLLQSQLLLERFGEQEQATFIPYMLKRFEFDLEKNPLRDGHYFYQKILANQYWDYYEITQEKRQYNIYLQKENNHLDLYYHCEKLRVALDMYSRKNIVNLEYHASHLPHIVQHYREHPDQLEAYPAINIYFHALDMVRHPASSGAYFKVKDLLKQHFTIFPVQEVRTLYNYLLNFCVRKINTGEPGYYEEILTLYKFLLSEQLLEQQGKLTQWTFINILTAGLRLKNFTWTEDFIHQYKDALAPENRENVYAYSLAALYFEKGDLDSALQLLQAVVFTDAFYQVAAKIIQLKIYYLQQEYDAFFSLSLATQRYLSRNKQLSSYQKNSNLNFLRIIKRLFQLKSKAAYLKQGRYQEQVAKLMERIQETTALGNRKWLEVELNLLATQAPNR